MQPGVSAGGLGALARYELAVALGCLGYGALFILAGLLFKNPMVPAMLFLGWELVVPFLPPVLKVLSVSYHLTSFYPVPVASGPFAMLAEPTPPLLAILGLLVVSAVLLTLAAWRAPPRDQLRDGLSSRPAEALPGCRCR
jgi:hypothetical protein